MTIRETQQQQVKSPWSSYADNELLVFTLQGGLALVKKAAVTSRHTTTSTATHRTTQHGFLITWTHSRAHDQARTEILRFTGSQGILFIYLDSKVLKNTLLKHSSAFKFLGLLSVVTSVVEWKLRGSDAFYVILDIRSEINSSVQWPMAASLLTCIEKIISLVANPSVYRCYLYQTRNASAHHGMWVNIFAAKRKIYTQRKDLPKKLGLQ